MRKPKLEKHKQAKYSQKQAETNKQTKTQDVFDTEIYGQNGKQNLNFVGNILCEVREEIKNVKFIDLSQELTIQTPVTRYKCDGKKY
jgi:hypothetical protein